MGAMPMSTAAKTSTQSELFNPTDEHRQLREMLRSFVETEVDPQALEYNRKEEFNVPLFRKLGELGILGVTADPNHGGSGMDAVAACIAHEELAASDPAFCLSFLAHSMLFVNNLSQNGSEAQKAKYLPGTCDGKHPANALFIALRDAHCIICLYIMPFTMVLTQFTTCTPYR
jgi:isovaleryl-CoA dehydrogenase